MKKILDFAEEDKVLQFLIGLNEGYDSIRSQILLLDPLPTVNKTYSMVIRVEEQRELHLSTEVEIANTAGQENLVFNSREPTELKCAHCGKT